MGRNSQQKIGGRGKVNWKRYWIYNVRWQLGGLVLGPILWVLLELIEFPYIIAMIILQLVGAAIFYPIDMWIAKQKNKNDDKVK